MQFYDITILIFRLSERDGLILDQCALTGFKLGTFHVTVWSFILYTKFPYEVVWNFYGKFSEILFLWQSRQSDQTMFGYFFWKDKNHESLITSNVNQIFAWNFQNVCESTQSTIFVIRFPMWKLFGKKVKYVH